MKTKYIEYVIESLEDMVHSTEEFFDNDIKDEISVEIIEILTTAIYQINLLKPKHKKTGLFSRAAQFFKGVPR